MADVNPIQQPWGNLVAQIPQNIANVQNTNANTALQQQQTQGLSLANQLQRMNLGITKAAYARALNDFSGQMTGNEADQGSESGAPGGAPASDASGTAGTAGPSGAAASPAAAMAATSGSSDQGSAAGPTVPIDAAGINQSMYRRWFVNPAGTPQEQQYLQDVMLTGNPNLIAQAKARIDQNVKTRNAIVAQQSNGLFTTMASVADPNTQHPLTMLDRINPAAAQAVAAAAKQHGVDPDEAARQYATSVAQAAHQFTGRGIKQDDGGVTRDSLTGMPIPGVPRAFTRSQATLASSLFKPVTVQHPDGSQSLVPQWQVDGYKSPQQAYLAAEAAAGQYAPGMPGANYHVANALRAVSEAQKNQGTAAAVLSPEEMKANPVLTKALNDKSFNLPSFSGTANRAPNAIEKGRQDAIAKAYGELQDETEETAQNASTQLTYLQAAQKILSDPNFSNLGSLGLSGTAMAQISRLWNGGSATGRQEAAKYLSNAALQYARQLYGSRMTQTEVKMQLEDMNPNAAQTPQALQDLLGEQLRIAQYYNKGAQLVPKYLGASKDPTNYYKWYTKYYPMSDIVNQTGSGAAKIGNDAWRGTAPAQQNRAIALLKSNPKLASQFKAKYGFLPKGM